MLSYPTVAFFLGVWTLIYLIDYGLKTSNYTRQKYTDLTNKCGLSIQPFWASFFTTKLNGLFHRFGRTDRIPWTLWFTIGAGFTLIAMIFSLFLLTILIYNTFAKEQIEYRVIQTVIPGVNLPLNQLWIYFLTLIICAVLHEAGHAIAALRERVRLQGVGVHLYAIYPAAFVNLNSDDLHSASPLSQLRIYCAGVWHNFVLVVLAAVIMNQLPFFLSPVYSTGNGVGVAYLEKNSVISGNRGLNLGDSIIRINSCPVSNQTDWFKCLEQAHTKPVGYCVSGSYLASLSTQQSPWKRSLQAVASPKHEPERVKPEPGPQLNPPPTAESIKSAEPGDCCPPERASTHMCFVYSSSNRLTKNRVCLPARSVTERKSCYSMSDCSPSASIAEGFAVTIRPICVLPSPADNLTRLVRVQHKRGVGLFPEPMPSVIREGSPENGPVAILFLGPIKDLLEHVGVTNFAPRWPYLPFSPALPILVETFCSYMFSLSAALLLLNVVPCYLLDGQWILTALLEMLLPCPAISPKTRNLVYNAMMFLGSGLLLINVVLATTQLVAQQLAW